MDLRYCYIQGKNRIISMKDTFVRMAFNFQQIKVISNVKKKI